MLVFYHDLLTHEHTFPVGNTLLHPTVHRLPAKFVEPTPVHQHTLYPRTLQCHIATMCNP